jgi:hypothetical protein
VIVRVALNSRFAAPLLPMMAFIEYHDDRVVKNQTLFKCSVTDSFWVALSWILQFLL